MCNWFAPFTFTAPVHLDELAALALLLLEAEQLRVLAQLDAQDLKAASQTSFGRAICEVAILFDSSIAVARLAGFTMVSAPR